MNYHVGWIEKGFINYVYMHMTWQIKWVIPTTWEAVLKTNTVVSTEEIITVTNDQVGDVLYISEKIHMPETKDIKRVYRSDFELKSRKDAEELVKQKKAIFYHKDKESDFFVYNEKAGELIAFKKNDYLIYPQGYLTFDGRDYISYDDLGDEIGRF